MLLAYQSSDHHLLHCRPAWWVQSPGTPRMVRRPILVPLLPSFHVFSLSFSNFPILFLIFFLLIRCDYSIFISDFSTSLPGCCGWQRPGATLLGISYLMNHQLIYNSIRIRQLRTIQNQARPEWSGMPQGAPPAGWFWPTTPPLPITNLEPTNNSKEANPRAIETRRARPSLRCHTEAFSNGWAKL